MRIPIGGRPNSVDELLADLERRQSRPGKVAGDTASQSSGISQATGKSKSSAASNSTGISKPSAPSVGSRRPQRNPPARPPAVKPGPAPVARGIPIGGRPNGIAELLADLERRQNNRGDVDDAASQSSGVSQATGKSQDSGTPSVESNQPRRNVPAVPPRPSPVARGIAIGEQPNSLAELLADLERRQTSPGKSPGDAASQSSASSKKSKGAASVASKKKSATSSGTPPATTLPGQAPPVAAPSALPPSSSPSPPPAPAAPTPPAAAPAPPPASSTPAVASPSRPPPAGLAPIPSASEPARAPSDGNKGQVQNPVAAPTPTPSPSPTTLSTVTSPPASTSAASTPLAALPNLSASSSGPIATVLPPPSDVPLPSGRLANAEPQQQPQNNTGMAVGIAFGSIFATALVGLAIVLFYLRRKRQKQAQEDEQQQQQQAQNEKHPGRSWESKLYGSANRSTAGGMSSVSGGNRSTTAGRSVFNGGDATAAGPTSWLPLPPKLGQGFSSRASDRSTGLTALDEKQYKTYQNLMGRENQKQPLPFDHPFYQRDEWK